MLRLIKLSLSKLFWCLHRLGVFVPGSTIKWSDPGDKRRILMLTVVLSSNPLMASQFWPSRRTGIALVAGCILFSALAAAHGNAGQLSVSEIEEQLQVCYATIRRSSQAQLLM